jgi:hypothetical protein
MNQMNQIIHKGGAIDMMIGQAAPHQARTLWMQG